jgi:hypothetical protein
MIQFEVPKFAFRIRTRSGSTVDNLSIHGRDEEDARRKLLQMYRDCEILECRPATAQLRPVGSSFEDVVDLMNPPH